MDLGTKQEAGRVCERTCGEMCGSMQRRVDRLKNINKLNGPVPISVKPGQASTLVAVHLQTSLQNTKFRGVLGRGSAPLLDMTRCPSNCPKK